MKRLFKYIALSVLCAGALCSCEKFFDTMEGDLSKVDAESMVATQAGLQGLLADLYSNLGSVVAVSSGDQNQMFANGSRSTPTYYSSTTGFWDYKSIRAINKFLEALDGAQEKGIIDEATKNAYRGEGLFLRAYCYFLQVRVYGGIPIVDHSLDEEYDGGENAGLYVPRSDEKYTWDWVLEQLQEAADLLPAKQTQEMRVNKYTALAMKARVALWAASESRYWNRAPINSSYVAVQKKLTYMEESYALPYYEQAIAAAYEVIRSGAYKLYGESPATVDDAKNNLIELFQHYKPEEGLFGRSYETGDSKTTSGVNGWAPAQCLMGDYTGGSYTLTLNLADEYDYYASATDRSRKDGKIQTLISGDENVYFNDVEAEMTDAMVANYKKYDKITGPFELKDARFQAWVIYPGCTFRAMTINMQGGYVDGSGKVYVYPEKNDPQYKDITAYYPYGGKDTDASFFFDLKTNLNSNNRTFYCFTPRKFLDQTSNNPVTQSPWYDLRYAEVLLTYAEAVAESGKGDKGLAATYLNQVRHRAGFTDYIPLSIENVLHEWKVEFATENKWSDVLYRRRAFYNPDNEPTYEEGSVGHKLTLVPLVDLSGETAQYIFLRALPYSATSHFNNYSGELRFNPEQYYGTIPNHVKNRIEENNK